MDDDDHDDHKWPIADNNCQQGAIIAELADYDSDDEYLLCRHFRWLNNYLGQIPHAPA